MKQGHVYQWLCFFFVLICKTDEDGNGQDTGRRNRLHTQSNSDRTLRLKTDSSILKCLYRGRGQPHTHNNIYLLPDTKSYDDTYRPLRLLHQAQHISQSHLYLSESLLFQIFFLCQELSPVNISAYITAFEDYLWVVYLVFLFGLITIVWAKPLKEYKSQYKAEQ